MKIFHHSAISPAVLHWRNLAKFLGVEGEEVGVADVRALVPKLEGASEAVILDVESLAPICDANDLEKIATTLRACPISVLLLTTCANERVNRFLRALTGGAVQSVVETASAEGISFPETADRLSAELSAQSFPRGRSEALGLILSQTSLDIVMTLDQSPSFVRMKLGRASIFIWSTPRVFDIHRPLAAEKEFEDAADEYIPAIIFLRFACGDRCWRNPSPKAGLVIDDPLLRKNYGFINFPQLLDSARKHRYQVTLAFIPWNHRRTRARHVRIFRDYADCFQICAHGCDHTQHEFGSEDYEELVGKNFLARQRMERHAQETGLPSEPVMVCPQEHYSLEAMRAFADSRQFVGLVNTGCMPRNLATPQITGADLLLPAQDSFFGFPVFKRHYAGSLPVFAMALFLGKPAILVEHHDFFRDGPAGAEKFAARLEEYRAGVKWPSLYETVVGTHWQRRLSETLWEVRFFTDVFHFEPDPFAPAVYRFLRRIPETTAVQSVTVNGSEVAFARANGFLTFQIELADARDVKIQVSVAPVKLTRQDAPGFKYQVAVALRRGLSELRDNFIARNQFALSGSNFLLQRLRKRGVRQQPSVSGRRTEDGDV